MLTRIIFIVVLLAAGCAQDPERAAVRSAEALLDEGQVEAALDTLDTYLRHDPDAFGPQRLRIFILLKAERLDQAALALQELGPERAADLLARALNHRDRAVRAHTARLLADNPTAVEFRVLLGALDDSEPLVRRYCAQAIGKLRNPAALKPVFRLLHDDNWFVRAEAVTALGKLGNPRAAGWIVRMLSDPDGFVRHSAMTALRELASDANRALLLQAFRGATVRQQFGIALALAKLRERVALGTLTDALYTGDAEMRRRAAEALADYGDPALTNAIAELLSDPDPLVREQATLAIQKIQRTNAEPTAIP